MTATSVTSLLPAAFYSAADIDQNIKISGAGQEAASPLDGIDDNLGFLDFSIVQTDKTNPAGATAIPTADFIPTAEICFDVPPAALQDGNCLSLFHSRPATAGDITNQYTVFTENNTPGSTVPTSGAAYNDLTEADGAEACLALSCDPCANAGGDSDNDGVCDNQDCEPNNPNLPAPAGTACNDNNADTVNDVIQADGCTCAGTVSFDCPNLSANIGDACDDNNANTLNDVVQADCTCAGTLPQPEEEWNIQIVNSGVDCQANQACYTLQVQSASGSSWTLGDQNYRLFFDGDLMTVTSVTSLLPGNLYSQATVDMNQKVANQGQEAVSPLDDIDDNLGFLDFNIVETDKSNPAATVQLSTTAFTSVAQICVDVAPAVIADTDGGLCLSFVHSRPSTAGTFTTQYTVITENDAPNNTVMTAGNDYNDLTPNDGNEACLGLVCDPCLNAGGDSDNDGVCDDQDCEPNNPNLPAPAGTACNDNNTQTTNDVIQADGCTCAGTVPFDCPNLSANVGDACNDNNPNTTNDTVQADCTCAGTIVVDCPNLNANIGDACNDNDPTTTNDTVQADCTCAGTSVFDCPDLNANIGDACNDNNSNTTNDTVQADCSCAGTLITVDCPNLNANIGDACNDNNPLTTNDAVQSDCTCAGQPVFDCPNLSANIGDACNDNNANTTNDTVQADCTCAGTPITFDCPNLNANIGDACNDNNANTTNDTVQADCSCAGTPVFDCPNLSANIGDACNDNNSNTTNDTVQADCSCAGTPVDTPDCADISISTAAGQIIVSGLDGAPITSVQIFNSAWATEFSCFANCDSPTQTVSVAAGTYFVYVKFYTAAYQFICQEVQTVTVPGGDPCANAGGDSDNDGVCNDEDCAPYNPNLPTTPGAACNDGNSNTQNDVIQADGCTCAGQVPDDCANAGGDSDNDGVCDNDDCAPYNPNLPTTPGTACNDNNANTINDVIQADGCTCAGTPDVSNPDCANINVSTGAGSIIVSGLDGAPITSVQIFNSAWATEFSCFADCDSPTQTVSVAAGTYFVYVKYYDAIYKLICEINTTVTVGGDGCNNVTAGGTIGSNQTICPGDDPQALTEIAPPTGGTGNLEYIWLASTTGCPSALVDAISGATSASYDPGPLTETTYFRRCSRREDCSLWVGESNCVIITVESGPNCVSDFCDNITDGGLIGGNQTICPGDTPATLSNVETPSGGSGTIEYLWLASTVGCPNTITDAVAGGNQASYSPGPLTQTTYFRRCSRRSACSLWVGESNCVVVTVEDGIGCGGNSSFDVDLELTAIGNGNAVGPYENYSVTFMIKNTGAVTAQNVSVSIPQPTNAVFQGGNPFTATQGSYDPWSSYLWAVGTLTSNQTEQITLNYFSLAGGMYSVYGQVQTASGNDVDSTPGNGTPPTPNEDDEAIYTPGGDNSGGGGNNGGGGSPACPLTLTVDVQNISCDNNGTASDTSDDTFSFDLTVNGGNPWGWSGGGESGTYGVSAHFGPNPISAGDIQFTVTDNDNTACTTTVSVSAPEPCSDGNTTGGSDDCDDIIITQNPANITVSGLNNSTLTGLWIFDANWSTVYTCSYGCNATEVVPVGQGTYYVIVKKLEADWTVICKKSVTLNVQQFQNNNGVNGRVSTEDTEIAETANEKSAARPSKAKTAVSLYPNPTSGTVVLELENSTFEEVEAIRLINALGRAESIDFANISTPQLRLDLGQKTPGVYRVNVVFRSGEIRSKTLVITE